MIRGLDHVVLVVLGATDPACVAERYALLREPGGPDVELRRADRDGLVDVRFRD